MYHKVQNEAELNMDPINTVVRPHYLILFYSLMTQIMSLYYSRVTMVLSLNKTKQQWTIVTLSQSVGSQTWITDQGVKTQCCGVISTEGYSHVNPSLMQEPLCAGMKSQLLSHIECLPCTEAQNLLALINKPIKLCQNHYIPGQT